MHFTVSSYKHIFKLVSLEIPQVVEHVEIPGPTLMDHIPKLCLQFVSSI
jgi:hypothetical protein